MSKRKAEAQKEREAAKGAKPAEPLTLDELLKPANAYERLVAEHVRGRHDANLEAAIVASQRSVRGCLEYVAGVARKKACGSGCVVMAGGEVFGLAVHWFLDGATPAGTDAGAPVAVAPVAAAPKPAPAPKPRPRPAAPDTGLQMLFDFGLEAAS